MATWSSTLTNLVVSFLTADFSAARCVFEMKVTLVLFSVGEFRRNPVNWQNRRDRTRDSIMSEVKDLL